MKSTKQCIWKFPKAIYQILNKSLQPNILYLKYSTTFVEDKERNNCASKYKFLLAFKYWLPSFSVRIMLYIFLKKWLENITQVYYTILFQFVLGMKFKYKDMNIVMIKIRLVFT